MEAQVEVRYSGVVLGRIGELPSPDSDAPFFLPMREPMPVGTVLRLRLDDRETPVRVLRAIESADPNVAGMQVRPVGESEIVAFEFVPVAVPMLETPLVLPDSATPVVDIDPQKSAPEEARAVTAEATVVHLEAEEPPPVAESAAPAAETNAGAVSVPETVPAPVEDRGALPADAASAPTLPADAVPEAVPVAVGSSMTGALESATESAAVASETSADSSSASATGDLPPARPITGSSGRRKTKRRK